MSKTKLQKEFVFAFPLTDKRVIDLRLQTVHIGDLLIEGTGYFHPNESVLDINERYGVDIDFVKWQGTDIKPVLEITGGMDEIFEAAVAHVSGLFEQNIPEPMEGEKRSELFEQLAESIRIHNKIFYGI